MFGGLLKQSKRGECLLDRLCVEWFFEAYIRPSFFGFCDVVNVVLGHTEDDQRIVAVFGPAEFPQELDAGYVRHVPIQQNYIGQTALIDTETVDATRCLGDSKAQVLKNFPGNHTNDFGVVHDETLIHYLLLPAFDLKNLFDEIIHYL